MSAPEGPHCAACRHRFRCVLPQKEDGRVCGWYNAGVHKLVKRERPPKHTLMVVSG